MKHLAIIQLEFLKTARKWDELSYEEQKGYLSRHPQSKRKLTAKPGFEPIRKRKKKLKEKLLEKQENSLTNKDVEEKQKESLTDLQKFGIAIWGGLLYMGYDDLPNGSDNSDKLKDIAKEYLTAKKNDDEDTLEELDEWIEEGASMGGKPMLTKQTFDSIMNSTATELPEDMVVYKSGEGSKPKNDRWLSTTTSEGAYSNLGKEQKYVLPKGTPVIFSHGLADKNEVIVNSQYLK